MDFSQMFSTASMAALIGWALLILAPRWAWLVQSLRVGLIGGLSLTYAALIFVYFFRVEGGGFGSIGEVRTLFLNDGALLAGWVHYLAFDLFVGTWIARHADGLGWNRLLQAPILLLTFLFGPIGLLLFLIMRASQSVMTTARA